MSEARPEVFADEGGHWRYALDCQPVRVAEAKKCARCGAVRPNSHMVSVSLSIGHEYVCRAADECRVREVNRAAEPRLPEEG